MKRPSSDLDHPPEGTQDQTQVPGYPGTVLGWHSARPQTWTVQESQHFLQLCKQVYQCSLSIPLRLRQHRQVLASKFQLPPITIRKFLDKDLFGLTATLVSAYLEADVQLR